MYLKVKAHAEQKLELSEGEYPSHVTVYKILEPYVNQQKNRSAQLYRREDRSQQKQQKGTQFVYLDPILCQKDR